MDEQNWVPIGLLERIKVNGLFNGSHGRMFFACDDQMVGKCLRGDEDDLESIAADVEDDDMLLPCLEVTLKVPTPT